MTASMANLMQLVTMLIFITHFFACFFFLQAKWQDFLDDSWVVQEDLIGADISFQYTIAIYWALQTLTTVGFGDITIKTPFERMVAVSWMVIGVALYSYAIGTLTNVIERMDAEREQLNEKISVLKEFKQRTGMTNFLFYKVKRHLENNLKSENNISE